MNWITPTTRSRSPLATLIVFVLAAMALGAASSARAEALPERLIDPRSTYAVVAGVLEWKDPGLGAFPKEHRKDQELFDTLGRLGVPASQRTLFLDNAATATNVTTALRDAIAKAPAGSTLVFYYAGHGVKNQKGDILFATSDIRLDKLDSTGLLLNALPEVLSKFKGKRILLMADCCYSGGLGAVARALSGQKLQAVALTSAEASNVSTGNWTFTQTVLDALSGRALLDRDDNGKLTLGELAAEVKDGMRFRERQRSGYVATGTGPELLVAATAPVGPEPADLDPGSGPESRRGWVTVPDPKSGARAVGRILGARMEPGAASPRNPRAKAQALPKKKLLVELYDYSDARQIWVDPREAEPITFETWPVGTELDVRWNGQAYPAKVLKVEDGFMWITYPGYESSWDEWVTADRVVGRRDANAAKVAAKQKAKVEWKGSWYDAIVNSEKDGRFCISYVGYGKEWDECVDKKRIRF